MLLQHSTRADTIAAKKHGGRRAGAGRLPGPPTKVVRLPAPAEDYVDRPLDFNELLIEHPSATFAIRIEGESMTGAGIFPGDIAVVDRAREPVNGSIILALLDGAFIVKRYRVRDGAVWLQAENPAFADMPLSDGQSFEVWGVI